MGVSESVIGLTIVALGTSLPELAAAMASALRKEDDLCIGNILGSNLFNLLGVLGIAALIHPMTIEPVLMWRDLPVMVLTFLMLAGMAMFAGRVGRISAGVLLATYLGYQILVFPGLRLGHIAAMTGRVLNVRMTARIEHPDALLERAREVLETEAGAIRALGGRLDDSFVAACRLILDCDGHLIVTGMGKSGPYRPQTGRHAGLHRHTRVLCPPGRGQPRRSRHDPRRGCDRRAVELRRNNRGDWPVAGHQAHRRRPDRDDRQARFSLARHADVHLDTSVDREACPLGLAPTASTSAQLAMGDALAIALLEARGFTTEDFARSHPGGTLGKRLLLHIADVMHGETDLPTIAPDQTISEAIVIMTRGRLGLCAVIDDDRRVVGILTDGDLRRGLDASGDIRTTPVRDLMTPGPADHRPERTGRQRGRTDAGTAHSGPAGGRPDQRLSAR